MVEKTRTERKDEAKEALGVILAEERAERETQKEWKQMYRDVRDKTLEINTDVYNGDISPKEGVEALQEFVSAWEYTEAEKNSDE